MAVVLLGSKVVPKTSPLLIDEPIVTFEGSSSHSPDAIPPDASTDPKACKLSLLEVSTNPPVPSKDPLAVIEPEKLV